MERVFGNFDRSEKSQRRRGLRSGALRADAARQRARRVQFYHRQGETVAELAARFGVSRRTVFYDLRRVTPDEPEWVPDVPLPNVDGCAHLVLGTGVQGTSINSREEEQTVSGEPTPARTRGLFP